MAARAAKRLRRSDRRIPGHRNLAIARPILLDIGERREWIVEALQQHLFRHQHVVDLAAGFLPPAPALGRASAPSGEARRSEPPAGGARPARDPEPSSA